MTCIQDVISESNRNSPRSPEYQKPYYPICGVSCGCKGNRGEYLDDIIFTIPDALTKNIVINRSTR